MQSLPSVPEFEADPHEQTHKGNSIKMWKKKNCFRKQNKKKKSQKSKVDSPDSPTFLGLGDERKQKNDENQIKNPNPNPNREKREERRESDSEK